MVGARLGAVELSGAILTEVAERVFFGDTAVGAGAGDAVQVEFVFFGDAAHKRRRTDGAAGVSAGGVWGLKPLSGGRGRGIRRAWCLLRELPRR